MRAPPEHIFHHTPDTLTAWCAARAMPEYRATQILEWVYRKGVIDPTAMTNLSAVDRERLASDMTFLSGHIVTMQAATDGVRKLLIEWDDSPRSTSVDHDNATAESSSRPLSVMTSRPGPRTECVMIPSEDPTGPRRTACISSQVGCPVGCRFCASGLEGLEGNLTAGRIVEQAWRLNHMLAMESEAPTGQAMGVAPRPRAESRASPHPRLTNIVFMGMGEPLANISNVIHAVGTLASPWGLGISARKITISTVGLPRAIERLARDLDLPVTLALSLHAPTDDLRRKLIPWAQYSTIAELLAACRAWFEKTGREITLEYTLLRGVNDRPEHAATLAGLAKQLRANVNLIRYNEVAGLEFQRPLDEDVREFQRILRARHVAAHIRASRGRDIAAACGQLRHERAAVSSSRSGAESPAPRFATGPTASRDC